MADGTRDNERRESRFAYIQFSVSYFWKNSSGFLHQESFLSDCTDSSRLEIVSKIFMCIQARYLLCHCSYLLCHLCVFRLVICFAIVVQGFQ